MLWAIRRIYQFREGKALIQPQQPRIDNDLESGKPLIQDSGKDSVQSNGIVLNSDGGVANGNHDNGVPNGNHGNGVQEKGSSSIEPVKNFSAPPAPPTFDEFLLYFMALGVIMCFFFLCEYRKVGKTILKFRYI